MKKIKYIIVTIVLFFIITPSTKASVCDKADILRVKSDANKVTIDYDYKYNPNELVKNGKFFTLKIKGITEDIYIYEKNTGRTYTHKSKDENGIINMDKVSGGSFEFNIYYYVCDNRLIRTMKYNLPKYNYYSEAPMCEGITGEELDVCDEWYQGDLDDETFKQKIEEYKKDLEELQQQEAKENTIFNKIKNFLLDNYVYIIIAIVLIVLITIIILIRRKRGILE